MSGTRLITRGIATTTWHAVAVHYPSAADAKAAWERAERAMRARPVEQGVGIYRLRPDRGGGLPSGTPDDAHSVVVVGFDRDLVVLAERRRAEVGQRLAQIEAELARLARS